MAGAPKGNDNNKKGKVWSEALRKHVVQNRLMPGLAKKLVDMALDGDMVAMKELGDRLEGKCHQTVGGDGEDGGITIHIRKFFEPDESGSG